ncbi:MAG: 4-hydroxy-tetrahydrodipicolinate reductase [Planctomycetaceae bacterium]
MIRVGVVGATGKMGREVCRAVAADPDLALVAAVSRSASGSTLADAIGLEGVDLVLEERLDAVAEAGAEVLVDFTAAAHAPEHVSWAIDHGLHVVEGTTGFAIDDAWRGATTGVFVAPNFAIGAVLMMRFAEQAARYLPAAEVIELHHDAKRDAPSGTAIATARRIAAAREAVAAPPGLDEGDLPSRGAPVDGVRVHSVRLPGLVAHQEVILGGPGQVLTIRHDSLDRSSFMPGVMMAIEAVPNRPGLTVGLDALLEG